MPQNAHLTGRAADELVFTLLDIANHLMKNDERMSRQVNLTPQQWLLLLQIAGDPNFPGFDNGDSGRRVLASEIAKSRGVSRANVSVLVTSLIKSGVVRQIDDPRDRRRKQLDVTRKGQRTLETLQVARARANDTLVAGFDQATQADLLEKLSLILLRARTARAEPSPTSLRSSS